MICSDEAYEAMLKEHLETVAALRTRLKDADETIRIACEQVSEWDTIVLGAYVEKYPDPVE